VGEVMKGRSQADWLSSLESAGVPAGPVNRIDQVFEDAQVKHRRMVVEMAHPLCPQPISLVANPIKMSASPPSYRFAPPTLGQHSKDVLTDFGLSEAEIADLQEKKII
jgi:crotonobetainyl-CoA:carnitine CoA-transferase CaiB-like acyl-CoA transferase